MKNTMIVFITMACVMLMNCHAVRAARAAEDSDQVNFLPQLAANVIPRAREGRQSVLGCLRGCTRELRPVRGEQAGREVILPNKCTFNIAQCKSQRNRQAPLLLSRDQSNIVYPSVGR